MIAVEKEVCSLFTETHETLLLHYGLLAKICNTSYNAISNTQKYITIFYEALYMICLYVNVIHIMKKIISVKKIHNTVENSPLAIKKDLSKRI